MPKKSKNAGGYAVKSNVKSDNANNVDLNPIIMLVFISMGMFTTTLALYFLLTDVHFVRCPTGFYEKKDNLDPFGFCKFNPCSVRDAGQATLLAPGNGLSSPPRTSVGIGSSVAYIGDFDDDQVGDIIIGAPDQNNGEGAVYVIFLHVDGSVKREQEISSTAGGMTTALSPGGYFGWSVAATRDLNGDGRTEIVVGTLHDPGSGIRQGAVYILFLRPDATVKTAQKITNGVQNFGSPLSDYDYFGASVAGIGSINGDNHMDIVVGAPRGEKVNDASGAVYVILLFRDGTILKTTKITAAEVRENGGSSSLTPIEHFGWSLAALGNIDGDSGDRLEVAVGRLGDGKLAGDRVAVTILFLNDVGGLDKFTHLVHNEYGVLEAKAGLFLQLHDSDYFGSWSLANIGDVDLDGVPDMAVGAIGDNDGGRARGAVYILLLTKEGGVKRGRKLSATQGGFGGELKNSDSLGRSLAGMWTGGPEGGGGAMGAGTNMKLVVGKDDGFYVVEGIGEWFVPVCSGDENCIVTEDFTAGYVCQFK